MKIKVWVIRFLMGFSLLTSMACGGTPKPGECGGELVTSCELPADRGAHTCYDVVSIDAAHAADANRTCVGPYSNGTVIPACCNHSGAIARCVFRPSAGGTSTEWFLSGSVADAEGVCQSKSGTFTAL